MATIAPFLPESNITFQQVAKLRKAYNLLTVQAEPIIWRYDTDPSSENLRAMLDHAKKVGQAYRLWDIAHRECYGF